VKMLPLQIHSNLFLQTVNALHLAKNLCWHAKIQFTRR
jgi:hypothetical protein